MATKPDPPAPDDASQLFLRYRTCGDPNALTALFDAVAPELLALGSHFARDLSEAEDLVQETFLVAIREAQRWDASRPVMPWLLGILTNEAQRARTRQSRTVDPERLAKPQAPEAEVVLQSKEVQTQVERAVSQLPERYAEVVRSAVLKGEAPAGIAARLGLAPGTVRVQLHRGLDLLRRALPAGISLGVAGTLTTRGLGQVRRVVQAEAALRGPALAASGGGSVFLTTLGGVVMGWKTVAAVGLAIALLGGAYLTTRTSDPALLAPAVAPVVSAQATKLALDGELEAEPRSVAKSARPVVERAPEAKVETVVAEGPCVVTGRVTDGGRIPLEDPWVALLAEAETPSEPGRILWKADMKADGTFRMEVPRGRSGKLLYTAYEKLVGSRAITVPGTGDLVLGDLLTEEGVFISGTALRERGRMPEGTLILAQAVFESTPLGLIASHIQQMGNSFVHSNLVTTTDDRGRFAFVGIEPGARYRLLSLTPGAEARSRPAFLAATAGLKVTAPASGIRLELGAIPVTLVFESAGRPVPHTQVLQRLAPDDPQQELGSSAMNLQLPHFGDESGELNVQVTRGYPLYLEARANGHETLDFVLDADKLERGARIPVELLANQEVATLEVTFAGPPPGSLAGFSAYLFVRTSDFKRYRVGPAVLENGVARFEELACNVKSAMVSLVASPSASLAEMPFERFSGSQIALDGLKRNRVRKVELAAGKGGRVELRLRGLDPSLAPSFELVEASGNAVRPPIYRDLASGHSQVLVIDDEGPYVLGMSLPGATYTLRQTTEAYVAGEVELTIAPGRVTTVTFDLERN